MWRNKRKESKQNLIIIITRKWLDSIDRYVFISEWCSNRKRAWENKKRISKQDEKKQNFWQKKILIKKSSENVKETEKLALSFDFWFHKIQ